MASMPPCRDCHQHYHSLHIINNIMTCTTLPQNHGLHTTTPQSLLAPLPPWHSYHQYHHSLHNVNTIMACNACHVSMGAIPILTWHAYQRENYDMHVNCVISIYKPVIYELNTVTTTTHVNTTTACMPSVYSRVAHPYLAYYQYRHEFHIMTSISLLFAWLAHTFTTTFLLNN